jgi:hypothetical protein
VLRGAVRERVHWKGEIPEGFYAIDGFLHKAIVIFAVLTENSVGAENAEGPIVRVIMVAIHDELPFHLCAFVASSFRTRGALQTEILALRHQLALFKKSAPRRFRLHRTD